MRKANLLRRDIPQDNALSELFSELSDTRTALAAAYMRFNSTAEPELIDAAIYEINSVQSQYNYLLRIIKEHDAEAACKPLTEGVVTWT